VKNSISKELKEFRRLELAEIDPDILIAGMKAKLPYAIERVERLQMLRELRKIRKLLEETGRKELER